MITDLQSLSRNFLGITRVYFEQQFLPSFSNISKDTAPFEVIYQIAGVRVRLLIFDRVLKDRLLPAFAHLVQTSEAPDFTVHLIDGSVMPLVPPWSQEEFVVDQAERSLQSRDFYGVYMSGEESLNFFDTEKNTAYFWTNDVAALPGWVIGAPLRTILHWILSSRNIQLVHGAAVGKGDQAVLLTAKSGSGKSTTALACVLSGMNYLGDDYVGITPEEDSLAVHSLYDSAKMTPTTGAMFPELNDRIVVVPSADDRKSVVYLSQLFPERVVTTSQIRAILIPQVDREARVTWLRPARPAEALHALAPTVFFQLPYADRSLMERLARIVSHVPSYHLSLGSDVRTVPHVVDQILSSSQP